MITGCADNNEQGSDATADTIQYFQLKQFINKEVAQLQTTPYFIYQLTETGNKKDSAVVNKEQFAELARPFAEADINNAAVKKYYTESVFEDQSTASFILNYKSKDPARPLQNIDVMLNRENQKVKRVDIRKVYEVKDTVFTEHMVWKANESFQVIKNAIVDTVQTTTKTWVIWNSKN